MVIPLACAGVAVGADGLIVEVHDQPDKALSDGAQALTPEQYDQLIQEVRPIHEVVAPQPVALPEGAPAPSNEPPPDSPGSFHEAPRFDPNRTFFVGSGIEMRVPDPGRFGAGLAWYRLMIPTVPGREPSPTARVLRQPRRSTALGSCRATDPIARSGSNVDMASRRCRSYR